jgi:dTDP-4-dehydrorhamnose 3,5-epimerase
MSRRLHRSAFRRDSSRIISPSPPSGARFAQGSVCDVAVDLRIGSPTYAQWLAVTLTAAGGEQLFVPRGFAHAFCTLEPDTIVVYKVDAFYAPGYESGLIWNDPTLAVKWPIAAQDVVLSDRDQKLGRFADFVSPFRHDDA